MQSHVTVIPSDSFISVGGEGMFFEFPCPAGVHAIQWQPQSHCRWQRRELDTFSRATGVPQPLVYLI